MDGISGFGAIGGGCAEIHSFKDLHEDNELINKVQDCIDLEELPEYSRQERGNHIKLQASDPTRYHIIACWLKVIKPLPCYFLQVVHKKHALNIIISQKPPSKVREVEEENDKKL